MKQKFSSRLRLNLEPPHVISSQCILESRSAFCLFIKHTRSDMCGNLPTAFSGYVIFEGLLTFLGKLRNVEFRNYSTVYCS